MTDIEYTRNRHPELEETNNKLFEIMVGLHGIGHPELERTIFPRATSSQVKIHAKQLTSMANGVKLNGGKVQSDYR